MAVVAVVAVAAMVAMIAVGPVVFVITVAASFFRSANTKSRRIRNRPMPASPEAVR
ncbi:hypothetical protein [Streptomyces sp. NPDC093591]|uniref:hypothetical protein n=1 Tax=Streptomyces sp. NPDC093591 TaxID=3366044 RepID=UPI003819B4C2